MKRVFFAASVVLLATLQSASAYDDSYLQPSAGGQFYQEAPSEGTAVNDAGCFPTSLAYSMRYQKRVRNPSFENLLGPSPSSDESVDTADWIQYFYKSCQTVTGYGTPVANQISCIRQYYNQSGYTQNWVYRIGSGAESAPDGENFARAFTINDVRTYLKAGYSLIIEIDWLNADSQDHWSVVGGHAMAVIGYDYDNAWGDEKIVLKTMDPSKSYYGLPSSQSYTNLLMENMDAHPNYVVTPAQADGKYIVTGFGYAPQYQNTALTDQLVVFAPQKL